MMENRKPFNPNEIDETLIRIVAHGGRTYALFLYIDAIGTSPEFKSVARALSGPMITADEMLDLAALVKERGRQAAWFISFNTVWLMRSSEAKNVRPRAVRR